MFQYNQAKIMRVNNLFAMIKLNIAFQLSKGRIQIPNNNLVAITTTQPTTQNKTKQLGWCGYIIGKKPTPPHHTTPGPITIKAVLDNIGS